MSKHKLSRALWSLFAVHLVAGMALLAPEPAFSVSFKPKGSPQTTAGGGARGICSPVGVVSSQPATPKAPIAALIPATDGELTAAAYPTVLVWIPESESLNAEFSLWDENSNGIYQTTVAIARSPGIVSFKLPSAVEPLELGKRYKWSVAVICDATNRQRDVVVEGWLQRTELSSGLSSQLNGASPLQKAQLYAQNGFWYDTVTTLAELRLARPEDTSIAAQWQELLESVGLTELGQAPLVDCCQAQN